MKKHVEQIFRANEFRADDHDPKNATNDKKIKNKQSSNFRISVTKKTQSTTVKMRFGLVKSEITVVIIEK